MPPVSYRCAKERSIRSPRWRIGEFVIDKILQMSLRQAAGRRSSSLLSFRRAE
jgi:hypothetical protein